MTYAVWDPTLETGNELVDSQHRRLYEMINELHDAIVEENALETQEAILDELMSYAHDHFRAEEALMMTVGFPRLEEQKRMHREFAAEAKRLAEEREASATLLPITIALFLYEWLSKHIRVEDRRIGEFIRERGV